MRLKLYYDFVLLDTDNLRNCNIQEILPIELPGLVHFKCDCIHGGCECCNINSTNVTLLVLSTGVSGYLQLPAGNHTVECISFSTSRMVSERYISLMEGTDSLCSTPSTTSTTQTTTSTGLSTFCISPSIDCELIQLYLKIWVAIIPYC